MFEDFEEKKLFLEHFGLISAVKQEKITDSESNGASFKISLHEIIVIEDDDVDANSLVVTNDKSKLLSKTKSVKTCKTNTFTKGVRGKTKKLITIDFSSPLGRKIDFSSGKLSKSKSSNDGVPTYEKWCSTSVRRPVEDECKRRSKSTNGRHNSNADVMYNFRKRPIRNDIKLSERSRQLLRSMKSCYVNVSPTNFFNNTKTPVKTKRSPILKSKVAFDHSRVKLADRFCKKVEEKSSPHVDVCANTDTNTNVSEDDSLISGVYSLAPGASPDLPSRLLEVTKNLIRSQETRLDTPQKNGENCSDLQTIIHNVEDLEKKEGSILATPAPISLTVCESRNINIIDLCDVGNEDCFIADSGPKTILNQSSTRRSPTQPLKQISQDRARSGKEKDSVSSSCELRVLSFLCRICNQVIKCRGSYRNDMLKHYGVEHNISSVNLVSHVENGKIVWKVVEKSSHQVDHLDNNFQKYRKRTKENNLFPDGEPKKAKYDSVSMPRLTSSASVSPMAGRSTPVVQNHTPTVNLQNLNPEIRNSGPELFSSDVICID